MIFTPFAFNLSPRTALRVEKGRMFKPLKRFAAKEGPVNHSSEKEELKNHVIIVGYGLNGRNLGRVLRSRKIGYVIIELNPDTVKEAAGKNEYVVYGDATKAHILEEAGINSAKVVTFAISDPLVIDHAVAAARNLNPGVHIIARTKYVSDIDLLYELGADTVFSEEYETSIEILARVMMLYGLSREAINRELNELHKQRYAQIRDKYEETKIEDKIHQVIHEEINIDSYTITNSSRAAGKTIGELNIRAESGAMIISVIREKENNANPPAEMKLNEGDLLILMGTHEQVEKAVEILK
jgi:CPA2 family monovalent cation:H+ antiporter-2